MSKTLEKKKLALAVGAALATSLSAGSIANAATNPFGMTELSSGYMQVAQGDGSCGAKMKEASCGDKGSCGAKAKEGSCGDKGSCGAKAKEGSCGGEKSEAKCGEGKCAAGKCAANK